MKKIFLSLLLAGGAFLSSSAQYSSLVFTTDKGEELAIPVKDLVIKIDGDLLIAQSENNKLEIPTKSLTMMAFGDADNTGVAEIPQAVGGPVEFFTLDGKSAGCFNSFEEARTSLENNVYVVKLADGSFLKVYIKK